MTDDAAFLGHLTPEDVLLYYDGPRAFTARSSKGHLLLVSWLSEVDEGDRYVVTPISLKTLQALRNNQLALRDALDSGVLWLVVQGVDGKLSHAELLSLAEVDQRFPKTLPAPGVCLQPIEDPWLETTLIGPALTTVSIPGSVLRRAVDGIMEAMKVVFDYLLPDYSPQEHKDLYDPPICQVAFSSLRVSIGNPCKTTLLFQDKPKLVQEAGDVLKLGLELASKGSLEAADDRARVGLEACYLLAPPLRGDVQEVRSTGKAIGRSRSQPLTLGRSNAARLRKFLQPSQDTEPFEKKGRIGEFDKDNATFIVRDESGTNLAKCRISSSPYEILYEVVNDAFYRDQPVLVVGERSKKSGWVQVNKVTPIQNEEVGS